MVVLSEKSHPSLSNVPTIDLSCGKRGAVSELLVKACESHGFFMVRNHGVSQDLVKKMEMEAFRFFALPESEKEKVGPANPLGYGCRKIGLNGDVGRVEYLLLHTRASYPIRLSHAAKEYITAVRDLACQILDLIEEGLGLCDTKLLSSLLRDCESDSVFRLNHYPPCRDLSAPSPRYAIGFGEHSDPQILTILHSNETPGLQISLQDENWITIPPDPTSFCVNVGDALQVLTNGRFKSVRHRALANGFKPRLSMVYFGAPPLHSYLSPLPQLVNEEHPSLYRLFTWCEYKKATYSLRLGHNRLDLFRAHEPRMLIDKDL